MAKKRTRNISLNIRLSDAELSLFREKLEQSKAKSQADFLLQLLSDKPLVVYDGLAEIYAELRRQGNNLNQIARSSNAGEISASAKAVLDENHRLYDAILKIISGR